MWRCESQKLRATHHDLPPLASPYKGGVVGRGKTEKEPFPVVVPMLVPDFDIRKTLFNRFKYWTKVQYTACKRFDRNCQIVVRALESEIREGT